MLFEEQAVVIINHFTGINWRVHKIDPLSNHPSPLNNQDSNYSSKKETHMPSLDNNGTTTKQSLTSKILTVPNNSPIFDYIWNRNVCNHRPLRVTRSSLTSIQWTNLLFISLIDIISAWTFQITRKHFIILMWKLSICNFKLLFLP